MMVPYRVADGDDLRVCFVFSHTASGRSDAPVSAGLFCTGTDTDTVHFRSRFRYTQRAVHVGHDLGHAARSGYFDPQYPKVLYRIDRFYPLSLPTGIDLFFRRSFPVRPQDWHPEKLVWTIWLVNDPSDVASLPASSHFRSPCWNLSGLAKEDSCCFPDRSIRRRYPIMMHLACIADLYVLYFTVWLGGNGGPQRPNGFNQHPSSALDLRAPYLPTLDMRNETRGGPWMQGGRTT